MNTDWQFLQAGLTWHRTWRISHKCLEATWPGSDLKRGDVERDDTVCVCIPFENNHKLIIAMQKCMAICFDFAHRSAGRNSAFCKACTDRRNDISHFGGQRHAGDNRELMTELMQQAEALAYLYQAVLLQEINVPTNLL